MSSATDVMVQESSEVLALVVLLNEKQNRQTVFRAGTLLSKKVDLSLSS